MPIACLILPILAWQPSIKGAAAVINVCELLSQPSRYEGQSVRVRGRLRTEGTADDLYFDELIGHDCSDLREPLRVQIMFPDSHFLAQPPKNYHPDSRSIRNAERAVAHELAKGHLRFELKGVVEGTFYLRGRLRKQKDRSARFVIEDTRVTS